MNLDGRPCRLLSSSGVCRLLTFYTLVIIMEQLNHLKESLTELFTVFLFFLNILILKTILK
jgi:hypothetical protein